jgi:predicted metalloprotease
VVAAVVLPARAFAAGPADVITIADRQAVAGGTADDLSDTVQNVAGELDAYWSGVFAQRGWSYTTPKLLLQRGGQPLATACDESPPPIQGGYCPDDDTIKLDLDSSDPGSFVSDMTSTGRDYGVVVFAVAHEWAHHVQNARDAYTNISLTDELQADCLSGVFTAAYYPGSGWESEMDDIITSVHEAGSPSDPERTHGTPSERVAAFNLGYEAGDASACRL